MISLLALLGSSTAGAGEGAAQAPPADDTVWERMPGLSTAGGIGLPGLPTAVSGAPWQLRMSLSAYGFQESNLYIQGDRDAALSGALQLDVTLGQHLEVWTTMSVASNRNQRGGPRVDPQLVLSLGDLGLGIKLHGYLGRGFALALQPVVNINSSGGDLGPNWSATRLGADALLGVDLQHYRATVPLALHAALGFYEDRSSALLDGVVCAQSIGAQNCANSRIVAGAAYGVRYPRVRLGLGAIAGWNLGRYVALGPLAEYQMEAMTGDGDAVIRAALMGQVSDNQLNNRVAQWVKLGVRLATASRLTLDVGVDLALTHPGYAMGPHLPLAAGYGVLTWVGDLVPGHRRHGRLTDEPMPPSLPPPPLSQEPPAAAGELRPMPREGAASAVAAMVDTARQGRRHGQQASLRVDVVDEKGQPIAAQVALLRGGQRIEAPPDIAGGFLAVAPAGLWTIRVDSDGYLSREQAVVLPEGGSGEGQQSAAIVLHRRPAQPSVKLGPDYLVLSGSITFQLGTADLRQTSLGLLNEVAELLVRHPELKRVLIEGHTDNAGPADLNQQLSEDRARAVRNYLVQQGVAQDRLEIVGLGSIQPLMPNLTPAYRARNRRVAFKILERDSGQRVK